MNDEIVARLEAERLRGMPRWRTVPAWVDELRRRAEAVDNRMTLVGLAAINAAPSGALTPESEGLAHHFEAPKED